MIIAEELKKEIIEEVRELKDVDDCVGIDVGNNKGLFIQVVDYEEKEYLIELNDIVDGAYEPCADYNSFSEFGNMDKLIESIEDYLNINL